ncbi:MAG: hypothetical protein ACP5D7_02750 [Limnospira sp.]
MNVVKNRSPQFWFSLSLLIPLYFGIVAFGFYLNHPYLVQDDARHHVVWLQKFADDRLFPRDFIADYFYTVAPAGYKFFYWAIAQMGVGAISAAKIVPTVLALIATIAIFKISIKIFDRPEAAFLSVLIFNENVWMNDDLISATPRAFLYPIFAFFIYFSMERSPAGCSLTIALLGLFFPQFLFVTLAMLTLQLLDIKIQPPYLSLSKNKENYLVWISGFSIAAIAILIFASQLAPLGEAITSQQMNVMPEFGPHGRVEYFGVNPFSFIFDGNSGLNLPLYPFPILSGLALPVLLKYRLSETQSITPKVKILFDLLVAALGLFILAHIFLFKLYFPSRYTYHSLIFILAIASGIVLCITWDDLHSKHGILDFNLKILLVIALILPFLPIAPFIFQGWVVGEHPELYQFFAAQPPDSLTASLADEADNLPAFSRRSVLVSREFAIPHHVKYYQEIERRTVDLVRSQYSSDPDDIVQFIERYRIQFWLLESHFNRADYLSEKSWLVNSSFNDIIFETVEKLEQNRPLAILPFAERCAVFSDSQFTVLDTTCLLEFSGGGQNSISSSTADVENLGN